MAEIIKETFKEFLRILVVDILGSAVIALGIIGSGINTDTGVISINWAVILAVFAAGILGAVKIGVVKAIDKFTHEIGKESGNESLEKGITRF